MIFVSLDAAPIGRARALRFERALVADKLARLVFIAFAPLALVSFSQSLACRTATGVRERAIAKGAFIEVTRVASAKFLARVEISHVRAHAALLECSEVARGAIAAVSDDGSNRCTRIGLMLLTET